MLTEKCVLGGIATDEAKDTPPEALAEILTADRVEEIFTACLFKAEENHDVFIKAEGLVVTVGFHPERLEEHAAEIEAMLAELPNEFQESFGADSGNEGGWSFLNACQDSHGRQWTGLHQRMEQLLQLGMGIGKARYLLPRELWVALPGGMPYFVVLSVRNKVDPTLLSNEAYPLPRDQDA